MLIVIHCFMTIKQEWVVEQEIASYCFSQGCLMIKSWIYTQYNPVATYQCPSKLEYRKNRSFQYHYLQLFPWLGYSAKLDGCLCLPCCLFSLPGNSSQNFVQKAYSNWTKLNEKVKAHSCSSVHLKYLLVMESYKDAHSGKQPTIDTSFDQ